MKPEQIQLILEDGKAEDIRTIDVRQMTTIADTMIICSGTSGRHVSALANRLILAAKKAGSPAKGVEGQGENEWVLMDFDDSIVHIMQPNTREHYSLENLWSAVAEHRGEAS